MIELRNIRAVGGTQARGFEHLCFQLRDPAPADWTTTKTGDPDGGVEWYHEAPDGDVLGFQCKFVWDIADLISSAKTSFETVARNLSARNVRALTFYAPFDLPDAAERNIRGRTIKSARAKWNDAVKKWQGGLPEGVDIDVLLITEGQILERLAATGNEGRLKFFFEQDHLARDWFVTKLRSAVELADERYTPESNVDLVIGRDIDALRLSPRFVDSMTATKIAANDAVTKMFVLIDGGRARSAFPPAIAGALSALDMLRPMWTVSAWMSEPFTSADIADIEQLAETSTVLSDTIPALVEHRKKPEYGQEGRTAGGTEPDWSITLLDSVNQAEKAVSLLIRLGRSTAAAAARGGSLLVTGDAGQGKTHLLIDSSQRALADGGLAICILGEVLDASRDILTQISEHLGLGPMPHDVFLKALSAAAQTTSSRLLISIDALNESGSLARWSSKLVSLVSAFGNYPDLALVVSCRTDFETLVLPSPSKREALGIVERRHPGFLGRELEALEVYFSTLPNAWAKAPMLQPDFSNPLFVKLYAGGFEHLTEQQSAIYDKHRSSVFDRFIASRVENINRDLQLDPRQHKVEDALRAFETRLAQSGASKLADAEAIELFTSFVPERTNWPDTLFQKLRSEGVIGQAVLFVDHESHAGVQFAYQALGDYRIASATLTQHYSEIDAVRNGTVLLADESPLRAWYTTAAHNVRQAFVVLYAEATGHELLDGLYSDVAAKLKECVAAETWAGNEDLRDLLAMTVGTIPHRRPSSVTNRTIDLAKLGQRRGSFPNLWDSVIAVTAEPAHILNADRLHAILADAGRVKRDKFWIEYTWHILSDDTSPLLRLIRWAEQTETPPWLKPGWSGTNETGGADKEVVRLAATTLTWLLTSSNRFVRDRTTKALVQLLLGYGPTLVGLLERFAVQDVRKVNDAYLTQRLVVIAYGWAMRVGSADPDTTTKIAEFMRDCVLNEESLVNSHYPDVLTRDAAQGVVDLAEHLIPGFSAGVRPPYLSTHPQTPPTEEALEKLYGRDSKNGSQPWASIYWSIFSLGDFGRYEIEPAVRHISLQRRTSEDLGLKVANNDEPKRIKWRWDAFLDSLDPILRARADEIEADDLPGYALLFYELDENQQSLFLASWKQRKSKPQTVSDQWARRWVFTEVTRLGWTPERFSDIESRLTRGRYDRQSHKAERIGKKYQWMALYRLVAKLLDNNYYTESYSTGTDDYSGAWQLGMRNIDPSLPPAYFEPPNYYDTNDGEWASLGRPARANGSTFTDAVATTWDIKPRALPERAAAADWAVSDVELPSLDERLIRHSQDGTRWVALSEYATHSAASSTDSWDDGRAEEWTHIYGWLVRAADADTLVNGLENQTLMGRWMPEGGDRTSSYLGEIGWSRSWENPDPADIGARFGPETATRIDRTAENDTGIDGIFVLPASFGYLWESSTADCSLEESVNVTAPSVALLATESTRRHPDTPDWYDGEKRVATNVRFDEGSTRGSILLVDEDWLVSRLMDEGWVLVAGLLGERRILASQNKMWQQFDHVARLDADGWKYGRLRPKLEHPYREATDDGARDAG